MSKIIIIICITAGIAYLYLRSRVGWGDEDPDHLPIDKDWDPSASRGIVRGRRNMGEL